MKAIFFCGDRSPYGLAHVQPLLDSSFEIIAVVAATDKRWKTFRTALQGDSQDYSHLASRLTFAHRLRRVARRIRQRIFGKGQESVSQLEKMCGDKRILHCDDVNSDSLCTTWSELNPDLVISAAYPQIFSADLLSVPSVDSINFHPSALPKYRGAHPHYWAIREGATTTGVTAHRMTPELDAGAIIAQRTFQCADLTYSELYDRIVDETPHLVEDVESFYIEGAGKAHKQKESEVSYYRNDRTIHSRIFWDRFSHREICNLVRTEKAFCFVGRRKVRIVEADFTSDNRNMTNEISVPPGAIVDISSEGVVVHAKEGFVVIRSARCQGKVLRPLEFAKNLHLGIGEVLN